jgi:branched-subunit amino acid permease
VRTINVKYETVLSYFKQKDSKDLPVFTITFMPLITDLLNQLNATELIDKIESESKEPIKVFPSLTSTLKLETFELKALSKEYPIQ